MVQKVTINYGFTTLSIPSIGVHHHIIKLKFNTSTIDELMYKLFSSLDFTHYDVLSKKGVAQTVFLYNTTDYTVYQDTCNKVREFLIRKKITKLYDQLQTIHPQKPVEL